jgi:hypothetical protein
MEKNKTILISNFHDTMTRNLINDFNSIGYKVVMPKNNWGEIDYFFDNSMFKDVAELISLEEFYSMPECVVLITCHYVEDDLLRICRKNSNKVIHYAGNNNTVYNIEPKFLLCADIQTYINTPSANKIFYFPKPHLYYSRLSIKRKFNLNIANTYIHFYQRYWKSGYKHFDFFKDNYLGDTRAFGNENDHGALTPKQVQRAMINSTFTLHFKEAEGYGLSVIESMLLFTPVITVRYFVNDKTIGCFFLDNDNAIVAESMEEVLHRLRFMKFEEYERLAINAHNTVLRITDSKYRHDSLAKLMDKVDKS